MFVGWSPNSPKEGWNVQVLYVQYLSELVGSHSLYENHAGSRDFHVDKKCSRLLTYILSDRKNLCSISPTLYEQFMSTFSCASKKLNLDLSTEKLLVWLLCKKLLIKCWWNWDLKISQVVVGRKYWWKPLIEKYKWKEDDCSAQPVENVLNHLKLIQILIKKVMVNVC